MYKLKTYFSKRILRWNNTPRKKSLRWTAKLFDYKRSNKRKICSFGLKKNTLKKYNTILSNNKSSCMIRTRDVWITSPTLSPLGYGLSYMMPSIQFFFKNEMSFRLEIGQFVMMLFHLNTIFLVDQYKLCHCQRM